MAPKCPAGYQPPDCRKQCLQGTYGLHCASRCPSTCLTNRCNAYNGTCYQCKAGFSGDRCHQTCPKGVYGQDCATSCSKTCQGSSCNPFTGYCYQCMQGFGGTYCERKLESAQESTIKKSSNRAEDETIHVFIYLIVTCVAAAFICTAIACFIHFLKRKLRRLKAAQEDKHRRLKNKTPIYKGKDSERKTEKRLKIEKKYSQLQKMHGDIDIDQIYFEEQTDEHRHPRRKSRSTAKQSERSSNSTETHTKTKHNNIKNIVPQSDKRKETELNKKHDMFDTAVAPENEFSPEKAKIILAKHAPLKVNTASRYSENLFFKSPMTSSKPKVVEKQESKEEEEKKEIERKEEDKKEEDREEKSEHTWPTYTLSESVGKDTVSKRRRRIQKTDRPTLKGKSIFSFFKMVKMGMVGSKYSRGRRQELLTSRLEQTLSNHNSTHLNNDDDDDDNEGKPQVSRTIRQTAEPELRAGPSQEFSNDGSSGHPVEASEEHRDGRSGHNFGTNEGLSRDGWFGHITETSPGLSHDGRLGYTAGTTEDLSQNGRSGHTAGTTEDLSQDGRSGHTAVTTEDLSQDGRSGHTAGTTEDLSQDGRSDHTVGFSEELSQYGRLGHITGTSPGFSHDGRLGLTAGTSEDLSQNGRSGHTAGFSEELSQYGRLGHITGVSPELSGDGWSSHTAGTSEQLSRDGLLGYTAGTSEQLSRDGLLDYTAGTSEQLSRDGLLGYTAGTSEQLSRDGLLAHTAGMSPELFQDGWSGHTAGTSDQLSRDGLLGHTAGMSPELFQDGWSGHTARISPELSGNRWLGHTADTIPEFSRDGRSGHISLTGQELFQEGWSGHTTGTTQELSQDGWLEQRTIGTFEYFGPEDNDHNEAKLDTILMGDDISITTEPRAPFKATLHSFCYCKEKDQNKPMECCMCGADKKKEVEWPKASEDSSIRFVSTEDYSSTTLCMCGFGEKKEDEWCMASQSSPPKFISAEGHSPFHEGYNRRVCEFGEKKEEKLATAGNVSSAKHSSTEGEGFTFIGIGHTSMHSGTYFELHGEDKEESFLIGLVKLENTHIDPVEAAPEAIYPSYLAYHPIDTCTTDFATEPTESTIPQFFGQQSSDKGNQRSETVSEESTVVTKSTTVPFNALYIDVIDSDEDDWITHEEKEKMNNMIKVGNDVDSNPNPPDLFIYYLQAEEKSPQIIMLAEAGRYERDSDSAKPGKKEITAKEESSAAMLPSDGSILTSSWDLMSSDLMKKSSARNRSHSFPSSKKTGKQEMPLDLSPERYRPKREIDREDRVNEQITKTSKRITSLSSSCSFLSFDKETADQKKPLDLSLENNDKKRDIVSNNIVSENDCAMPNSSFLVKDSDLPANEHTEQQNAAISVTTRCLSFPFFKDTDNHETPLDLSTERHNQISEVESDNTKNKYDMYKSLFLVKDSDLPATDQTSEQPNTASSVRTRSLSFPFFKEIYDQKMPQGLFPGRYNQKREVYRGNKDSMNKYAMSNPIFLVKEWPVSANEQTTKTPKVARSVGTQGDFFSFYKETDHQEMPLDLSIERHNQKSEALKEQTNLLDLGNGESKTHSPQRPIYPVKEDERCSALVISPRGGGEENETQHQTEFKNFYGGADGASGSKYHCMEDTCRFRSIFYNVAKSRNNSSPIRKTQNMGHRDSYEVLGSPVDLRTGFKRQENTNSQSRSFQNSRDKTFNSPKERRSSFLQKLYLDNMSLESIDAKTEVIRRRFSERLADCYARKNTSPRKSAIGTSPRKSAVDTSPRNSSDLRRPPVSTNVDHYNRGAGHSAARSQSSRRAPKKSLDLHKSSLRQDRASLSNKVSDSYIRKQYNKRSLSQTNHSLVSANEPLDLRKPPPTKYRGALDKRRSLNFSYRYDSLVNSDKMIRHPYHISEQKDPDRLPPRPYLTETSSSGLNNILTRLSAPRKYPMPSALEDLKSRSPSPLDNKYLHPSRIFDSSSPSREGIFEEPVALPKEVESAATQTSLKQHEQPGSSQQSAQQYVKDPSGQCPNESKTEDVSAVKVLEECGQKPEHAILEVSSPHVGNDNEVGGSAISAMPLSTTGTEKGDNHKALHHEKKLLVGYGNVDGGSSVEATGTVKGDNHKAYPEKKLSVGSDNVHVGSSVEATGTVKGDDRKTLHHKKNLLVGSDNVDGGISVEATGTVKGDDHKTLHHKIKLSVGSDNVDDGSSVEATGTVKGDDHKMLQHKKKPLVGSDSVNDGSSFEATGTVKGDDHKRLHHKKKLFVVSDNVDDGSPIEATGTVKRDDHKTLHHKKKLLVNSDNVDGDSSVEAKGTVKGDNHKTLHHTKKLFIGSDNVDDGSPIEATGTVKGDSHKALHREKKILVGSDNEHGGSSVEATGTVKGDNHETLHREKKLLVGSENVHGGSSVESTGTVKGDDNKTLHHKKKLLVGSDNVDEGSSVEATGTVNGDDHKTLHHKKKFLMDYAETLVANIDVILPKDSVLQSILAAAQNDLSLDHRTHDLEDEKNCPKGGLTLYPGDPILSLEALEKIDLNDISDLSETGFDCESKTSSSRLLYPDMTSGDELKDKYIPAKVSEIPFKQTRSTAEVERDKRDVQGIKFTKITSDGGQKNFLKGGLTLFSNDRLLRLASLCGQKKEKFRSQTKIERANQYKQQNVSGENQTKSTVKKLYEQQNAEVNVNTETATKDERKHQNGKGENVGISGDTIITIKEGMLQNKKKVDVAPQVLEDKRKSPRKSVKNKHSLVVENKQVHSETILVEEKQLRKLKEDKPMKSNAKILEEVSLDLTTKLSDTQQSHMKGNMAFAVQEKRLNLLKEESSQDGSLNVDWNGDLGLSKIPLKKRILFNEGLVFDKLCFVDDSRNFATDQLCFEDDSRSQNSSTSPDTNSKNVDQTSSSPKGCTSSTTTIPNLKHVGGEIGPVPRVGSRKPEKSKVSAAFRFERSLSKTQKLNVVLFKKREPPVKKYITSTVQFKQTENYEESTAGEKSPTSQSSAENKNIRKQNIGAHRYTAGSITRKKELYRDRRSRSEISERKIRHSVLKSDTRESEQKATSDQSRGELARRKEPEVKHASKKRKETKIYHDVTVAAISSSSSSGLEFFDAKDALL